jgi:hypothetical protein
VKIMNRRPARGRPDTIQSKARLAVGEQGAWFLKNQLERKIFSHSHSSRA